MIQMDLSALLVLSSCLELSSLVPFVWTWGEEALRQRTNHPLQASPTLCAHGSGECEKSRSECPAQISAKLRREAQSCESKERRKTRVGNSLQLAPDKRPGVGPVVRSGVELIGGVAIPAIFTAFLPEQRAIEVRAGDTKEREHRDCEGELEDEEAPDDLGPLPLAR